MNGKEATSRQSGIAGEMVKDDVFLNADVWFLVFEDDELLFSHAAREISIKLVLYLQLRLS